MKLHEAIQADLDNRFAHHAPSMGRLAKYAAIRYMAKEMAVLISESVPPGNELALSLVKVEEAMFWANAGIAREL